MPAPKITKITIGGTIPTAQYTDIRPTIEVETNGDTEGAKKLALEQLVDISQRFAVDGKEFHDRAAEQKDPLGGIKLTKVESLITGGVAYKDNFNHFYNEKGEKYLSASSFIKKYKKDFPKDFILPKMVGAYGGETTDWEAIWGLQGEISTQLGKAIHAGIELYGKYRELGEKAGAKEGTNKALPTQPYVKWAVEKYFEGKEKEDADYEALILDDENLRMGLIDRLLFVDREKKIVRVQDMKTNADLQKKEELLAPFNTLPKVVLSAYQIQLSWYAEILEKYGYTVEGLDIDHLTADGWERTTIDRVDLKGTI